MADTKITALAAIATVDPAADVLPIVDISDTSMAASGTTKKVTSNQILGAGGTATLASATITGAATVGTTLGVTGVSTFAAGTALLPALTTTGDTNTGIYYPAADTFAVTTGGTERYRVDSTGLGIGGSPVNPLTVFAAASANAPALLLATVGSTTYGWDFSVDGVTTGNLFIRRLVASVKTDVMEFDRGNGNVGIGVTPAGTGGCLQLKSGVTFPATQVASSDANTLDDYEEGTWTPTSTSGTNLTSISHIFASYTKIGRVVTLSGYFSATVTTGSTLTYFTFAGLPFAVTYTQAGALYEDATLKVGFSQTSTTNLSGFFAAGTALASGSKQFTYSITYYV